jgi:hypothetical protein
VELREAGAVIFSIRSDSSELVFSEYLRHGSGDEWVRVDVKATSFQATRAVWLYRTNDGLNSFFQQLARFDGPWRDHQSWKSIEGELSMFATCDSTGHVTFRVILRDDPIMSERWFLDATLITELGQLERIARDADAFFNAAISA